MNTTPASAPDDATWLRRWWWVWLSLTWVFVGHLFAAQTVWLSGFPWDAAISWAVLDWGLWIPLAPFVVWLAKRMEISATTWRWRLPAHIAISLVLAATIEFSAVFALRQGWMPDPRPRWRTTALEASALPAPPPPPESDGDRAPLRAGAPPPPSRPGPGAGQRRRFPIGLGRARLAVPIYFVLVAATHALAHHRRSLERERRAVIAEAKLAEAQALAMQTQLQPHFFFNALNTVASLIYTQPEQAEETICALGELMRGVLDASHRREISLREELNFVDRYLAVQQIRFGARLQVTREIPEATLTCAVPTLLLQPLVENAVVHGVAPFAGAGTIGLRAAREAEFLVLEITNPSGPAAAADDATPEGTVDFSPRVGITNARSRLAALYGTNHRFEHRRMAGGTIVTRVAIPWKGSPS